MVSPPTEIGPSSPERGSIDGRPRLPGVTALGIFFAAGAAITAAAGFSLLNPGGFLEPMWRLNPRAREALLEIGGWAVLLLFSVSVACGAAAIGLWHGRRWGHRLAVLLIAINLAGDLVNGLFGGEPRALVGVPIAAALLLYLSTARVRSSFRKSGQDT
jgi:hypothetical protein